MGVDRGRPFDHGDPLAGGQNPFSDQVGGMGSDQVDASTRPLVVS